MPPKKDKALTKAQLISDIATKTDLSKTQVTAVFDAISVIVKHELKAGNPIAILGLVKITLNKKSASPARPGRNPFTGADIIIKAKPARNVVKVRALKALKDMV